MQDLISVIVPVYNVENYLEQCVQSIRNQTYSNLEIILVDDGSGEKCRDLCDVLSEKDDRIQVIHKKNGGLSDARNAGIEVAKGDYLLFIDGDDYISPTMIEKMWNRIIEDKTDLVICGMRIVNAGGKDVKSRDFQLRNEVITEREFWKLFYGQNFLLMVHACNKMYRKKLFDNERYDYGKLNEDEFIIHRLISISKSISIVAEDLYNYVRREGSIMTSSYSIKRLDGVEALNTRTKFFIEKKEFYFASRTLEYNIDNLLRAYRYLDMKKEINRARYKGLKAEYTKCFFKVARYEHNIKFLLKGILFLVCPRICDFVLSFR